MQTMKKIIMPFMAIGILIGCASCSGRTDDNMQPTGETIEVVIPEQDVTEDAVIANGGEEISVELPADSASAEANM